MTMELLPTETLSLIVEYVGVDCLLHMTTPAMHAKVMSHVRKYEFKNCGLVGLPRCETLVIHDHVGLNLSGMFPKLTSLVITKALDNICRVKLPPTLTKFSYNWYAGEGLLAELRRLPLVEWELVVANDILATKVPTGEFRYAKLNTPSCTRQIPEGVTDLVCSAGYSSMRVPDSVTTLYISEFYNITQCMPKNVTKIFGRLVVSSYTILDIVNKLQYIEEVYATSYDFAVRMTVKMKRLIIDDVYVSYDQFLLLPDVEEMHIAGLPNCDMRNADPFAHPNLKKLMGNFRDWPGISWVPKSVTSMKGIVRKEHVDQLDIEFEEVRFAEDGVNYIHSTTSHRVGYTDFQLLPMYKVSGRLSIDQAKFIPKVEMRLMDESWPNLSDVISTEVIVYANQYDGFAYLSDILKVIPKTKELSITVGRIIIGECELPDHIDKVFINNVRATRSECTVREWKNFWEYAKLRSQFIR